MNPLLTWRRLAAFLFAALSFTGCASQQLVARRMPLCAGVSTVPSPATTSVPVAFQSPDAGIECSVTARNFLGEPITVGHFNAGEMVSGVFQDFAGRNFATPSPVLPPAGTMTVRICRVTAEEAGRGRVKANVEIVVELRMKGSVQPEYSKNFSGEATAKWVDKGAVPEAFYIARDIAVREFLAEWRRGDLMTEVAGWTSPRHAPIIRPPEIKKYDFKVEGKDACRGTCVVVCNDWGTERTKAWADKWIDVTTLEQCENSLGIKPERIRIVHVEEQLEPVCKEWRIQFRAAAHSDNDPPEFRRQSIEKIEDTGVHGHIWQGTFTVACNGAKDADAKIWAYGSIRSSFGAVLRKAGVAHARVRMVFTSEEFDGGKKEWTIKARAFERTEMVFSFSKSNRSGCIILDPDLMGLELEKSIERARAFVQSEMDKRVGVGVESGTAKVRYGDYTTEPGNLVVLPFNLER